MAAACFDSMITDDTELRLRLPSLRTGGPQFLITIALVDLARLARAERLRIVTRDRSCCRVPASATGRTPESEVRHRTSWTWLPPSACQPGLLWVLAGDKLGDSPANDQSN